MQYNYYQQHQKKNAFCKILATLYVSPQCNASSMHQMQAHDNHIDQLYADKRQNHSSQPPKQKVSA